MPDETRNAADFDLELIRRKPAYRAAIWMSRLAVLPMLTFLYTVWTGRQGSLTLSLWAAGFALILASLGLLAMAGIPFARTGTRWSVSDRAIQSQIRKDFWRLW